MNRRLVVLAAAAVISASVLGAQAPVPQSQLPTFRTGVDVVELDVTVLDKDRHPVPGLTAADFTIYRVALPVAHLAPGAYLLEVEARSGARRVTRSARFAIEKHH